MFESKIIRTILSKNFIKFLFFPVHLVDFKRIVEDKKKFTV
jgi:hypothetical protein